jgi:hypothetical protein
MALESALFDSQSQFLNKAENAWIFNTLHGKKIVFEEDNVIGRKKDAAEMLSIIRHLKQS